MKLIIGNKNYSSWSLRGWLAAKQSGLAFEEITVPLYGDDWDAQKKHNEDIAPSSGKVPVLWDGEFMGGGRSLDDLPADDFTLEVLARVVRDLSDRLGRLVYSQDELQQTLRGTATAIPPPFRA